METLTARAMGEELPCALYDGLGRVAVIAFEVVLVPLAGLHEPV